MRLEQAEIVALFKQLLEHATDLAATKTPPRQAHWVYMREACRPAHDGGLGWSETMLKNGIL